MMNIIGKWKVALAASFDDNGLSWLKPDEYRAAHSDEPEDVEQMLGMVLEFTEDGELLHCSKIPEGISQEQIDEAVKAGEIRVKDGYIYDAKPWKEENGKFLFDSGIEGEVFGEAVSSWMELPVEDDGTLNYMNMFRFERI